MMTPDSSQPVLRVEGLIKSYGNKRVVDGLSFEVSAGEIVGLLGPNGAGKTTAFYMTMGLIKPDGGKVWFKGQDVTRWPIHQRAHAGMGYLAQEPSIFRPLTVEENILSILETLPLSKTQRNEKLQQLLAELHLEHLAKKVSVALSGGERRRLEITRALVTNPQCLLLDEPFANIDPISVEEVKALVKLLASRNISVLITDHNAREIFSLVDRSYLVYEGKVLCSGDVNDLVNDPLVRTRYLGEHFHM
ncbi:MAG: LPS export ABC transporter ATP-binding protein [Parachlamydiales bacterium]|jgi:lipopolysaccharide export system ATP-binding protein